MDFFIFLTEEEAERIFLEARPHLKIRTYGVLKTEINRKLREQHLIEKDTNLSVCKDDDEKKNSKYSNYRVLNHGNRVGILKLPVTVGANEKGIMLIIRALDPAVFKFPINTPSNRGLKNVGNTCYINSLLQAIMSCNALMDIINKHSCNAVDCFSCSCRELAATKSEAPIAPDDIIDLFYTESTQQRSQGKWEINFEAGKQEDAFIALVFAMQEIVTETRKDLFIPTLEQRTKCIYCSKESFTMQKSQTLELYRKVNFKETLTDEISSAVELKCECDGNMAIRRCLFKGVPPLIVCRLWSFSNDGTKNVTPMPIDYIVKFPTDEGDEDYVLRSAIVHHGDSMHEGHYTALCFRNGNSWHFDDSLVTKIHYETFFQKFVPYLMFYEKIDKSTCVPRELREKLAKAASNKTKSKVVVCGASSGIGQSLSLLLKSSQLITELALYDNELVSGIVADLSQIDTRSMVVGFNGSENLEEALQNADVVIILAEETCKQGTASDDCFKTSASTVRDLAAKCAKTCPNALIAIVSDALNSTVPIACETLAKAGVLDPKRVFGVTTADVVCAYAFIGKAAGVDPQQVNIPVIGGHSGVTIMPLMSQCKPPLNLSADKIKALMEHIQQVKNKATHFIAYAGARFALSLVRAIQGEQNVIECAYVRSDITVAKYFATPLLLGKNGIEKNLGYGELNAFEQDLLAKAIPELKKNIQIGEDFVNNNIH